MRKLFYILVLTLIIQGCASTRGSSELSADTPELFTLGVTSSDKVKEQLGEPAVNRSFPDNVSNAVLLRLWNSALARTDLSVPQSAKFYWEYQKTTTTKNPLAYLPIISAVTPRSVKMKKNKQKLVLLFDETGTLVAMGGA